eukprot:89521_1
MSVYNPPNNINPQNPIIGSYWYPNSFLPYRGQTNIVSNSRWNPLTNRNHHIHNPHNIRLPTLRSMRDRLEQTINTSKNKSIKLIRLNITYKSINDTNISIEVPINFSLYQIHDIIQSLFSFNDSRLHQFILTFNSEKLTFTLPDPDSCYQTDCNSDGYHWVRYMITRQQDLTCDWQFDERVISIYDALCLNDEQKEYKVLEYEYDFSANHTIFITAEEIRTIMNPKELQYPAIIETNEGYYCDENRNLVGFDMDLAQERIDLKFHGQWPLELREDDKVTKLCYVCKNNYGCPNKTQCSGVCCIECIKTETVRDNIDLDELYLEYMKIKEELQDQHLQKIQMNGQQECTYME